MPASTRRMFLQSATAAAAMAQQSPNNRINVAVVGFHGRGMAHIRAFVKIPNVRVAAICDVDERLFPPVVAEIEKTGGYRPDTVVDMRRLLERKDIDAVSIATPDYWHALQTIWACQAGKDVYVEKPVSFTIREGRLMVEAARKYKRMVQAGTQSRSEPSSRGAMRMLHEGKMGKVYRASTDFSKPRASIGRTKEASIPQGVNWDLYLGPSPYRPFTLNRFHYGWHYFWDTGPTEVGNIGVHSLDVCRWGMGKQVHPVKVHCTGGTYLWDSEQEVPNLELGTIQYADGSLIDWEVNNLYAPQPNRGMVFYTSEGYVGQPRRLESDPRQDHASQPDASGGRGPDQHGRQLSGPGLYARPGDQPGRREPAEPLREFHHRCPLPQGGGSPLRHPGRAPFDQLSLSFPRSPIDWDARCNSIPTPRPSSTMRKPTRC